MSQPMQQSASSQCDGLSSLDLARSLATVADLAHPALAEHHRLTSYVSERLGSEMGLDEHVLEDLVLAAMLHDIGALTMGERLAALELDFENEEHCVPGALLLVDYQPFAKAAEIVRYHHQRWHDGRGRCSASGNEVPVASHVLFLADRVAVLATAPGDPLERRDRARDAVRRRSGDSFWPEAVAAFDRLASEEAFWFDLDALRRGADLEVDMGPRRATLPCQVVRFDAQDVERFAHSMSRIIDFKSAFTASHSAGVAAVAEAIGALRGSDARTRYRLRVGGLLHDVGKLSVSAEILEKPGELSTQERHVVESHPYFSYRVLQSFSDHEDLTFAALHHEQLCGQGYPFRLGADELGDEARIMAVADVFTALTEDRPYRAGLGVGSASIISEMVDRDHLDADVSQTLLDALPEIDAVRTEAQEAAAEDFRSFTALRNASTDDTWEAPPGVAGTDRVSEPPFTSKLALSAAAETGTEVS